MKIQIGRWGNSLGIRIPNSMVKELGLKYGTDLDLQEVSGSLILRAVVKAPHEYDLDELLAAIKPDQLHGETDWGEPVGKEEI